MIEEGFLFPVILVVPPDASRLPPRARTVFLSRHARAALRISARKSRLDIGMPVKDGDGRPLPVNGVYWSVTHKPAFVGAVVGRSPVGIDVEKITPRKTEALFRKVADGQEWNLAGRKSWKTFHRYWSAKEAVLKAAGTGLAGLAACRIIDIVDTHTLIAEFEGRRVVVEHFYFRGHIAAVVKSAAAVRWNLVDSVSEPNSNHPE